MTFPSILISLLILATHIVRVVVIFGSRLILTTVVIAATSSPLTSELLAETRI